MTFTRNVLTGFAALFAVTAVTPAMAGEGREIGEVSTSWQLIGPDHKVKIAAFEDPKIQGVTCYVSRAVTGGIGGALGLAEDTSDASVACRQTGPIVYNQAIESGKDGEDAFAESRSFWFKTLHVKRFYDAANGTLVYLTYSDKLVDGSPKNSISAVTPMPWGTQVPGEPRLK